MSGHRQNWRFGIGTVAIDEDEAVWEIYDYMYRFPDFQRLFDDQPFAVIGEVNGMTALARKRGEAQIFVVLELETKAIVPVAAGLKQLVSFLDEVQKLWDEVPGSEILKVTEQTREHARLLLEIFAIDNPGVDPGYWEYQCFAGLTIGFPLI